MDRKKYLKDVKRIVIKIGTSTLTYDTGLLNLERIEKIVRQIVNLKNKGYEIVLVSSGAVGAGLGVLKDFERPMSIPQKQAIASVGQVALVHLYQKLFLEYGKNIAQILLTRSDVEDRRRYLNARDAFFNLLKNDVIPIVNENDSVVTDEIKVGDNDTLSALVSNLVDADLLIILSDIKGLYDKNPLESDNAKLINTVKDIKDVRKYASDSSTKHGTGGMITKLKAADIVNTYGTDMIIAKGSCKNILNKILNFERIGTIFVKNKNTINAKQQWIGFNSKIKGKLIIDQGAKKAILNNKSLLPVGIKSIKGFFDRGETIGIYDENHNEVARGLVNYDHKSLQKIIGLNSEYIYQKLGYKDYDEVVHINNMMIKE